MCVLGCVFLCAGVFCVGWTCSHRGPAAAIACFCVASSLVQCFVWVAAAVLALLWWGGIALSSACLGWLVCFPCVGFH